MKLIRIENYYVNPDTVAYVYGKSLGGSYSGKDVTVVHFTGGGKPLEVKKYIDDVLEALGWQGTQAKSPRA
jgi:hypothetical protein